MLAFIRRVEKAMEEKYIKELLIQVSRGGTSPEEALKALKHLGYEDLGYAKVDNHRSLRQGFPEVIYCPGKSTAQIREIACRLAGTNRNLLATRAGEEVYAALQADLPDIAYNPTSRTLYLHRDLEIRGRGKVLVISAGTADLPVAEEAAVTAAVMGNQVERLYDVGVAGIHRLLSNRDKLEGAAVLIVVAGMEGALASVVGGMVARPVVAVPTSIGYGAHFQGLSPLLTMLNSCAAGVMVVNIDNGFGAGYAASLINRKEDLQP